MFTLENPNIITVIMNGIKENNIRPDITTKGEIRNLIFRLSNEVAIEFDFIASFGGFIFLNITDRIGDRGYCIGKYSREDVPFEETSNCTEKEIYDFVMSYDKK